MGIKPVVLVRDSGNERAVMSMDYAQEKAERCNQAAAEFRQAAKLANEHNLVLTQCSTVHYQLRAFQDGRVAWLYNLYPGKRRIWSDRKYRGSFLRVPKFWTLTDVIQAVADRQRERSDHGHDTLAMQRM